MSHVAAVGIANRLVALPTKCWQCRETWKSIYNPRSSCRKSSCSTSKPLLHTSNLGKVGTVSYKADKIAREVEVIKFVTENTSIPTPCILEKCMDLADR